MGGAVRYPWGAAVCPEISQRWKEEAWNPQDLTPWPVVPPDLGAGWRHREPVRRSPREQGPADCGAGARTCFVDGVEHGHIQSFTRSLRLLWPITSRAA